MVHLVLAKLKAWNSNQETVPRIAMISGTGGKAFCAGGDIVSVYNARNGKPGFGPEIPAEFFAKEYLMDYSLTTMAPL